MSDARRELAELRRKLAGIDREIAQRLNDRFECSSEVRTLLERTGEVGGVDSQSTDFAALHEAAPSVDEASLRAVFHQIWAEGRGIERPARVAFVSPSGGFCQRAAKHYFGEAADYVEAPTLHAALEEVVRGRTAYAVFVIESSTDGVMQAAVGELARSELVLVGERTVAARMDLANQTGNPDDIERVLLTAPAHAACERFLARELDSAVVLDVRSPMAALELARDDASAAVIVPEGHAEPFGFKVVKQNVGDQPDLQFRYGIAGRRPARRSGRDTTALLFSIDDSAGALYEVLRHFAERGVNLNKLQSRPVTGETWDYVFYAELSGHVTDRGLVTAIESIKRSTKYLKILGSYPAGA